MESVGPGGIHKQNGNIDSDQLPSNAMIFDTAYFQKPDPDYLYEKGAERHLVSKIPIEQSIMPDCQFYGKKNDTNKAFHNEANHFERKHDHNFSDIFDTTQGLGGSRSLIANSKKCDPNRQYFMGTTMQMTQTAHWTKGNMFGISTDNLLFKNQDNKGKHTTTYESVTKNIPGFENTEKGFLRVKKQLVPSSTELADSKALNGGSDDNHHKYKEKGIFF